MTTPRLISFLRDEDGWVSPFSLIMTLSMLSVLGVAVEYANIVRAKTQLQTASDAVALAAAQSLEDQNTGTTYGMEIAALYYGDNSENLTINNSDIQYGTWDGAQETFTASVVDVNSVRVSAEMSSARGNPLFTAFSNLTGLGAIDISTDSVVIASTTTPQTNVCESGGLFSQGTLSTGSNNDYLSGFCTYGGVEVSVGNNNYYEEDASLRGAYNAIFDIGNSNSCGGNSTCELQRPESAADNYDVDLPNEIDGLVTSLNAGDTTVIYDGHLYTVRSVSKLPKKKWIVPYSLYIVSGVAEFSSNGTYENLVIVAQDEVKAGSNTSFDNVVFATQDKILFGSNTTFGSTDYCADGRYSVYLFSGSNIEFGSNNEFKGMQMAAKDMIKFGSNVQSIGDVYGEAWGDIEYGSNVDMSNCGTALTSDFGWDPELTDDGDPIPSYALVF